MKLRSSEKQFNRKEDYKFMQDRKHQNAARSLLLRIAKENTWSRDGFINEAARRGFLKTPIDKLIVEEVLGKMNFGSKGHINERKRPDIGQYIKRGRDEQEDAPQNNNYKPLI